METTETTGAQLEDSKNSAVKGMSRRDFVERLRRTAIHVAPIVATISLMTPKAMGSP